MDITLNNKYTILAKYLIMLQSMLFYYFWQCPHSMQSRGHEMVWCPSIRLYCPSVCPSKSPQQQTRCCRFAAVGPVNRRYRLTAARPALSSNGVWQANAGSTTLLVCTRSWTQTCYTTKLLTFSDVSTSNLRSSSGLTSGFDVSSK